MRIKWEYKKEDGYMGHLLEDLNFFGKEGWEAFHFEMFDPGTGAFRYKLLLKREIVEPEDRLNLPPVRNA